MSQTTGYQGGVKNRRKRALSRLENQLVTNKKKIGDIEVTLTDSDVTRIKSEIENLKTRV